jgi:hypothetical protein
VPVQTEVLSLTFLPKKYKLRAIADANARPMDTGNYLKKIQPEKVVIYPADAKYVQTGSRIIRSMSKAL